MKTGYLTTTVVVAGLVLASCGSTRTERGISGAAIGTAGGLSVAALTSVGAVTGGVVGAAVGAVAGAFIASDKLNLGEPVWQ